MNDQISNTFSALADPTRRAILARLALGETSVTELAEPFEMSMPAVSKHLRVLSEVGLVRCRAEGRLRLYRLEPAHLQPFLEWLAKYERALNERLDRMDAYLKELQQQGDLSDT